MKLLIERSDDVSVLTEQTEAGKQLFIEGVFAQAEVRNGNGRLYPKAVLEKAVDQYQEKYISKRRALGELNHPERPFADPAEAAFLIESMTWQGNSVIGKAKVMNTPKGQIVKALLESGFNLGVSTRGLGSLKESNGLKVVQSDLMLTAVDGVDGPSAPDAYVTALTESVSWVEKNGVWVPIQESQNQITEQMFWDKFEQLIKGLK